MHFKSGNINVQNSRVRELLKYILTIKTTSKKPTACTDKSNRLWVKI